MQWKINLTQVICLRMGKTTETKPHRVNLRSPHSRIHYYQNKRLQVKGTPIPSTNLQLNLYLNTQLDLWCSGNLSFQCTNPSTWLTHQLGEDVGCKVFQFIQQWRLRSSLVTKPLARRHSSFLREYDELGQICLWSQYACIIPLHLQYACIITFHLLRQPLK